MNEIKSILHCIIQYDRANIEGICHTNVHGNKSGNRFVCSNRNIGNDFVIDSNLTTYINCYVYEIQYYAEYCEMFINVIFYYIINQINLN